jgi:RNA polymerase sigma-70 factor (ECF subfamily)
MDRRKHDQFVELYVRNQNRLYRYVVTLVPNRADAEELFQQTNLTLWKLWDRYDTRRDFVRWACGIAHNHVRNFLRKKENQQVLLSEEIIGQLAQERLDNEDLLEDRRAALAGCLEKLPHRQRSLVERCYSGERTIRAVAETEGRTPNVIYKLLRKIRALLYDCITEALATGAEA